MAEDLPNSEVYWDNIMVIKVEDRFFSVPRWEFVLSSEVFADMFFLPSGPGVQTEGQDKEHPIVLEGYKKDEFSSLLKVMYPTASYLISGTTLKLHLGKEEWVSVLKLSTIWNMEKIRKYAIHTLSTNFVLSPIEKIQLARAHQVAAWFDEGVIDLVSGDLQTLDDLAIFGWETAARILWMRARSQFLMPAKTLYFRRGDIKCRNCSSSASLINFDCTCESCQQVVPANAELNVSRPEMVPGRTEYVVPVSEIRFSHNSCRGAIFSSFHGRCKNCLCNHDRRSSVRVTPKKVSKEQIEEMFGEEIRNYTIA